MNVSAVKTLLLNFVKNFLWSQGLLRTIVFYFSKIKKKINKYKKKKKEKKRK